MGVCVLNEWWERKEYKQETASGFAKAGIFLCKKSRHVCN